MKLVWTREEEFTWAYFRPAGVIDVRRGVDADGTLTAWEFHNYNSGGSGIRTPYDVPNQRVEFHARELAAAAGLVSRAWRRRPTTSPASRTWTNWRPSLGMDPLAFRLQEPAGRPDCGRAEGRGRRVRLAGAKRAIRRPRASASRAAPRRAATSPPARRSPSNGRDVQVLRVVVAFECGAIVNPDGLRNQVEGAVVQGLGGALFEAIEFDDGQIANARFAEYRVPRFRDVPAIEIVLVDRKDLPSAGAGETPIVGIAPAIGNAIFDATGVRLRSLPLVPQGLPLPSSASR